MSELQRINIVAFTELHLRPLLFAGHPGLFVRL